MTAPHEKKDTPANFEEVDQIDLKIMEVLQKDARITNQALADRVALSPSACLRRVRDLETRGPDQCLPCADPGRQDAQRDHRDGAHHLLAAHDQESARLRRVHRDHPRNRRVLSGQRQRRLHPARGRAGHARLEKNHDRCW